MIDSEFETRNGCSERLSTLGGRSTRIDFTQVKLIVRQGMQKPLLGVAFMQSSP